MKKYFTLLMLMTLTIIASAQVKKSSFNARAGMFGNPDIIFHQ